MAEALPPALQRLLGAPDASAHDSAWSEFVNEYTPLLLHSARTVARDRDGAMEAYAHVLEVLRADDYGRLRVFRADGPAAFSTWLTIVARRIAVDLHRQAYGRVRGEGDAAEATRSARRRLANLIGADVRLEDVPALGEGDDMALVKTEQRDALGQALAVLPPRDRLLVRLRFEDDVPVREIAKLMRFPTVFHVYRRLNGVLAELRAVLERAGIDGGTG